jgi:hypothetical protein
LVIGRYRVGENYFDNLAVGYYDDAGELIFIAKINNGFTPDVKKEVWRGPWGKSGVWSYPRDSSALPWRKSTALAGEQQSGTKAKQNSAHC